MAERTPGTDGIFPDPSRELRDDAPGRVDRATDTLSLHEDDEPVRHAREDAAVPAEHRPSWALRLGGVSLAVMIGLAGAVLLLGWLLGRAASGLNPFQQETTDRSGPSVVTAIRDLNEFQAATGYYEVVIDQEKGITNLPSFLKGERVLFVAAGTVDATVDFSAMGPSAVITDAGRTEATIRLPAPTVGKAQLDLQRSYVADHQRGLTDRLVDAVGKGGSGIDTQEIYGVAEQRLTAAGQQNSELRDRAEANTRAMLTSMLTSLGYTKVTVIFEPQT